MVESKTGRVYIDCCRPSVFKQLLRFLYTGTCDLSGIGYDKQSHIEESSSSSIINGLDIDDENTHCMIVMESLDESTRDSKSCEDDEDEDDYESEQGIDESTIKDQLAKKIANAQKRQRIGRRRQQKAVTGRCNDDPTSDANRAT